MVLTDGKVRSVEGILKVFEEFGKMSGLRISMEKSTIYLTRVTEVVRADISNKFHFQPESDTKAGSWMWRKILKYQSLACTSHKMDIQSGEGTFFWYDVWSEMGRLFDLTGPGGVIDMGILLNATIASLVRRRRRRHRNDVLNEIEQVLSVRISHLQHGSSDIALWKRKNGLFRDSFSSKCTWQLIRRESAQHFWHSGIWFKHSTPKFTIFSWLAIQIRLSTGDRMQVWNAGASSVCILCSSAMECQNHLFFSCSYSEEVWTKLTKELMQRRFTISWDDII
ncbi:uncharacterized protein LOC112085369 [Eutrema salsugineum]|uniref:uncharacterized protein LOC112085369 n=1 Tax=Eutrema salsugineum TaxID=72664 RepID=UPI000CECFB38|nr:uncharacterized protein LOC112085369 [Eutrema salsugineum]